MAGRLSACELAKRLPYASSSNILIADQNGNMASLEISPAGCRILPTDNGQLCHTNHFLNDDCSPLNNSLAALTLFQI